MMHALIAAATMASIDTKASQAAVPVIEHFKTLNLWTPSVIFYSHFAGSREFARALAKKFVQDMQLIAVAHDQAADIGEHAHAIFIGSPEEAMLFVKKYAPMKGFAADEIYGLSDLKFGTMLTLTRAPKKASVFIVTHFGDDIDGEMAAMTTMPAANVATLAGGMARKVATA